MKTINFLKTALLTIALFVCGNVGAETITISKAAIPDLTEEASEHTFSINDIEFIGKLKYNGDNLFFTSGSDYFYNTTSLGTINSITIYYGTNGSPSAHQYFSSGDVAISGYQSGTAQLTSSTPGTSGIYSTFNGGFFNLSISNKNLQASSIVIDYTPTTTTPTEAYTVTFNAGTGTCETTSLTEATPGAGITLPTATSPCPENWTFVGWAKENIEETTTVPTLFIANSEYKPTAHETLYAVYTQEEEGQNPNEFKFKVEGDIYVGKPNGKTFLSSTESENEAAILGMEETGNSNECYLYYYEDNIKTYIGATGSSTSLEFSSSLPSNSANYKWTLSVNNNIITLKRGSRNLAYNKQNPRFSTYNVNDGYLYEFTKVLISSATYSTNPDCSAITVAAPTFNVKAGTYYEPQTVKITAEEGATIYYTINGDEPTTSSTEYNNDNPITISTTTTLKAIAVKENTNSVVTEATYILPTEAANIAAYNALGKNTLTKIAGTITVSYINGSNIYAQDETGAMLIYDYDYAQTEGLAAGATISNLIGTKSEHGGAAQMANVISSTIGEGAAVPAPTTITSVTEADLHKYVKLEDAQFNDSYSFTTEYAISATLSTHGEIVVRNNFKNFEMDVTATDKYDIIGFVNVFNGQVQIYPISIDVTTPSITLSTNSLAFETIENNQTKDLTFTINGANLSENATLAIAGDNAGYFTCDPTSITPAEDGSIAETNITVTYQPTATGEHAATLTITCGDLTKEIALSGTCINPILATPVAIEATAITANGFTANWEAVENATSYDVNVWKETGAVIETEVGNENLEGWTYETDGTYTTANNFGQSSPSIKFGKSGNYIESKVYNAPITEFSFWYKGQGSGLTSTLLIEGYNGSEWKQIDNITTLPTSGITTTYNELTEDFYQIKFTFTKESGNLAIDDITIVPQTKENIVGSPFTVTGLTNTAIINLEEETTYYYNVVAKADGYTASEASNTISVTTAAEVAEPTITITGDDLVETEGMYSVALGDTKFSTRTSKTFTLTATGVTNTVEITPEMGSLFFVTVTSEQATENMGILTFTPNEKKEVNATFTISNRINNEFNIFGFDNGEALMQAYGQSYGMAQNSPWYIINGDIRKVITVSLTPVEESAGTGLCDQPEMEGISFNGQEIINSLNLDVEVYNAIGQMVVRSNENINMSSYPAGVYVIKAANGESMKIVK